jgi:hypothetical protein
LQQLDERQVVRMTVEGKKKAQTFVDGLRPQGKADLVAALKAALRQQPQEIFLATSSVPDAKALRELFGVSDDPRPRQQPDPRAKVRVNIIAIDVRGDGERALRDVALATDGMYKWIAEKDLAERAAAKAP